MVYSKRVKSTPKVPDRFATPLEVQASIETAPSFDYRTVVGLLRRNKNTVQRVFQLMRPAGAQQGIGCRPRIKASPSVTVMPNARCTTELCRVRIDRDRWQTLDS
jgi:putative transposase